MKYNWKYSGYFYYWLLSPFYFLLFISLFSYLFILLFHWFKINPGSDLFYYGFIITASVFLTSYCTKIDISSSNGIVQKTKYNYFVFTVSGIMILAFMLFFTLKYPFPPIFNIHSYVTLDLASHYENSFLLPFLGIKKMITIAAQSNLYSQLNIVGFILGLFNPIFSEKIQYIIFSNMLSQIIFLSSGLFILSVIKNQNPINIVAPFIFICIVLSIPPLYEVFIKYISSDLYVIFCSVGVLIFSIKAYNLGQLHLLLFIIAFSNILRAYFALICLIFFVFFNIYYFISKKQDYLLKLRNLFKTKLNLLFLAFCFLLSISWFITLFESYNIITPDFRSLLLYEAQSTDLSKELIEKYSTALISSNVFEQNSFRELINGIINTNIYYKTFNPIQGANNNLFYNILKFIFSTPVVLTLVLTLFFIASKYLIFSKKKYNSEVIICYLWLLSIIITWILLYNSPYPIIKIFVGGIPAIALIITFYLIDRYSAKAKQNHFIKIIILYFLFSFIFNNSSNTFESMLPVNQQISIHDKDFFNKYGNKDGIIDIFRKYKINNEEIIWIVRPEHGGFISYFIDDEKIWNRKWYENLNYNALHNTSDFQKIIKYLKKNNIGYILCMGKDSFERFYKKPFKRILAYDSNIFSIINKKNQYFDLIFSEKPDKGTELKIYKIKDDITF